MSVGYHNNSQESTYGYHVVTLNMLHGAVEMTDSQTTVADLHTTHPRPSPTIAVYGVAFTRLVAI
jgi:hypothetical protein